SPGSTWRRPHKNPSAKQTQERAEREGFEPSSPVPGLVAFEATAFGRSTISPMFCPALRSARRERRAAAALNRNGAASLHAAHSSCSVGTLRTSPQASSRPPYAEQRSISAWISASLGTPAACAPPPVRRLSDDESGCR